MSWSPERYLTFGDQRTRPAADLLARIPLADPGRVADLGCGPGNSTALLVARWPDAEVVGIDNSADMLVEARASPLVASWLEADIARWQPEAPFDVLFANAAQQWLPEHEVLLPRLLSNLRSGGVLAVQMPANFAAPSHRLMREVAAGGPWREKLARFLRSEPVASPDWYYDLLAPLTQSLDVWASEYLHVLEGDDPILRWTRSTGLRPVIDALDEAEYAEFEAAYAAQLRVAYPERADGCTLFAFRRLFIVARRA